MTVAEPANPQRMRLKAEDDEDLTVLSSVLQDALVPVGDIAYMPDQRRLAMVVNRFCWECCPDEAALRPDGTPQQRVLTAFVVENVTAVRSQGIDRDRKGHLLEMLAVQHVTGAGGVPEIEILFAGDQAIRATVERIRVHLSDLREPYPTAWRPRHALDPKA